jgi:hypothetical protein
MVIRGYVVAGQHNDPTGAECYSQSSLKKRTDYGAAFAASGVTTYYCSQKGCSYQGHVSVDFVWKAVMKDDKLGLRVRWAFLGEC